jgi:RNA polymerase sigma factor (sigma-70 family)
MAEAEHTNNSFVPGDVHHARLEGLVRDYARLVRYAVRSVGGRHTTEVVDDIEQTVFLSLWQQVRREQTIDHPVSYLYRTAVRETVRVLRQAQSCSGLVERHAREASVTAGPRTPEQEALAAEQRQGLRRAMLALAPDRARAVRAHLQGFSVNEIMVMCGWDYQKARNLIARGMADLRHALRQRRA